MFQGFIPVLKMRFFKFSCPAATCYFTAVLTAWFALAASVHLNKGWVPFPSEMQIFDVWSKLEEFCPQFVSLLLVTMVYEVPFTAFCMMARFAATISEKPGKRGIACACFWLLLHILSWLRKWKPLQKYISLLDFSILHVSFGIIFIVML
jgi:hypothetical protein